MFSSSFVLLALSASALANVFITNPTASSTFQAGQKVTLNWQDDGKAPSLADFGPAKISVYAGNAQQQTLIQSISTSTDVSKQTSIDFTPDASVGPNSPEYFIRIESLGLKDAAAPQFPALAFSAKFTMSGMSGQFSADVQNQINGQSTAPLAGASSTAAPSSTGSTSATTTGSKSGSTSASASKTSGSAKPSNSSNAAAGRHVSGGMVLAGVVAAAVAAF